MPETPLRAVRIADDIWTLARRKAAENGETVTDVVRRALVDYITPPLPKS
jgi:hypothetical protein